MSRENENKKRIERWFLTAARDAGVPIPPGEIAGEQPDFTFQTVAGTLGVELCGVVRPARYDTGILPIKEEADHWKIIELAQRAYYGNRGAKQVRAVVYFEKTYGKPIKKAQLAKSLAAFVSENAYRANPVIRFRRSEMPDGFSEITLNAISIHQKWWTGGPSSVDLSEIPGLIEAGIMAKDKLVPTYRSNLASVAELWLLIYSGVTGPRYVPIPVGAENWKFSFHFDRVFWFSVLDGFVEIGRERS